MFHGVIQKITLAQFFFETRCKTIIAAVVWRWACWRYRHAAMS